MISISDHVGDIRHQISTMAFKEDIRIAIFGSVLNNEIKCRLSLFGRNLPVPLVEHLLIRVNADDSQKSE